jgi:hypothetical protein
MRRGWKTRDIVNYGIKFRRGYFRSSFVRDAVRGTLGRRNRQKRRDATLFEGKTCELGRAANPSPKTLTRRTVWLVVKGTRNKMDLMDLNA